MAAGRILAMKCRCAASTARRLSEEKRRRGFLTEYRELSKAYRSDKTGETPEPGIIVSEFPTDDGMDWNLYFAEDIQDYATNCWDSEDVTFLTDRDFDGRRKMLTYGGIAYILTEKATHVHELPANIYETVDISEHILFLFSCDGRNSLLGQSEEVYEDVRDYLRTFIVYYSLFADDYAEDKVFEELLDGLVKAIYEAQSVEQEDQDKAPAIDEDTESQDIYSDVVICDASLDGIDKSNEIVASAFTNSPNVDESVQAVYIAKFDDGGKDWYAVVTEEPLTKPQIADTIYNDCIFYGYESEITLHLNFYVDNTTKRANERKNDKYDEIQMYFWTHLHDAWFDYLEKQDQDKDQEEVIDVLPLPDFDDVLSAPEPEQKKTTQTIHITENSWWPGHYRAARKDGDEYHLYSGGPKDGWKTIRGAKNWIKKNYPDCEIVVDVAS